MTYVVCRLRICKWVRFGKRTHGRGIFDGIRTRPHQETTFCVQPERVRSLTAEKLFEGFPLYQVRSVGTQPDARIAVTEGRLGRADIIFCMEKSHLNRLRRKFPGASGEVRRLPAYSRRIWFMRPDLLDELRGKLGAYITVPE